MTRRKPRGLNPEEAELWDKVRKSAQPLKPVREGAKAAPSIANLKKPKPQPMPDFTIGESARQTPPVYDLKPTIEAQVQAGMISMDRKRFGKMKKGAMHPEGKIDLHGMTLAQAHPALVGFILSAHSAGKRLVLVITGKGRPGEDGEVFPKRNGVLRHQVPHWLSQAPLSGVILQVAQAHRKHGGGGAYYVYLRRRN